MKLVILRFSIKGKARAEQIARIGFRMRGSKAQHWRDLGGDTWNVYVAFGDWDQRPQEGLAEILKHLNYPGGDEFTGVKRIESANEKSNWYGGGFAHDIHLMS